MTLFCQPKRLSGRIREGIRGYPPLIPHPKTEPQIQYHQELPESQRADAVSSMAYEANARIKDPVYGCAGFICQLQKQVSELQAQLAREQAELLTMKTQHANLVAIIYMEMAQSPQSVRQSLDNFNTNNLNLFQTDAFMQDDYCQGSIWEEPLWTS